MLLTAEAAYNESWYRLSVWTSRRRGSATRGSHRSGVGPTMHSDKQTDEVGAIGICPELGAQKSGEPWWLVLGWS